MSVPDPAQYDAFAAEYEAHAAVAPYNALYDRPATLRLIGDVAGRRVLDAACGPGFYIDELLALGADVMGCDAAPTMIELARARVGDRAELRVHSLDDPFTWIEDESIDVVVCALAYHYVSNRDGFLRYLLLLLGDLADGIEARDAGKHGFLGDWGDGKGEGGSLLESLVRAYNLDPERLREVGLIIERIGHAPEGEAVVPTAFRDMWRVFEQAMEGRHE